MDIHEFQLNPVTEYFGPEGRGINVTFNADAFTPEFFRNAASRLREQFARAREEDKEFEKKLKKAKGVERTLLSFEENARILEIERDVYAALLTGTPGTPVLLEWGFTDKGEPLPITEEVLRGLHPRMVKDLYIFCTENALPKSPATAVTQTNQTTSATSEDGTSQAVESVAGPPM